MKTYQCPFCPKKFYRNDLGHHIELKHDDEVPDNLEPLQLAFDIINNHPDHKGHCVCCGKDTKWNPKKQKYDRICDDPKCAKQIRDTYKKRMLKVYGKVHLLDDIEHQKKMLAGRKISGTCTWSDGGKVGYVGSYEKKFLEFLDEVMGYKSKDIVSPGPTFEYTYNGKKHTFISDFLLIDYNLVFDIKPSKSKDVANPDTRNFKDYEEKQIQKEKVLTNQGVYSYIRLTDNDFGQLLSILAELKMKLMDGDTTPLFRIHESVLEEEMFILEHMIPLVINECNHTPIVCTVTETGRFVDDPISGDTYYECCTIKPRQQNGAFNSAFSEAIDYVRDGGYHVFQINPDRLLDGASVGILVDWVD